MTTHEPPLIQRVTSRQHLAAIGLVLGFCWVVAFVHLQWNSIGLINAKGIPQGGDFLGFYIAGNVILSGQGHQLYSPELQQDMTQQIIQDPEFTGFIYFVNPASVAVVCAAFAWMPFMVAWYVHLIFMLICLVLAMYCLPWEALSSQWWVAALLSFAWFPVVHTITGGQNAALSILLLSACYRFLKRQQDGRAGLCLGCLMFKPQLALPFLGLLLLMKRFRVIATAAMIVGVHYCAGALLCGWDWPLVMFETLSGFYREQERVVSGATHIALPEVLDFAIIRRLEAVDPEHTAVAIVRVAGYLIVGALILSQIWIWRTARTSHSDFGLYWGMTIAVALIMSLHTQYYECALLVLPLVLAVDYCSARGWKLTSSMRSALIATFLVVPLVYQLDVGTKIGFQPIVLVPVCSALWLYSLIVRARSAA